jgi:hypothetical protein
VLGKGEAKSGSAQTVPPLFSRLEVEQALPYCSISSVTLPLLSRPCA